MKILYVFPHPDDESFGPARAIAAQVRAGHEVYLLTLTQGGATRQRHALGLSVEQMGSVRFQEMQEMAAVLDLADLTVLNFPDGGLKTLDPRLLERAVSQHITSVLPEIVVSYPVHGISGFHDHLVTHAIVKQCFVRLRDEAPNAPMRLAFFTLTEDQAEAASGMHRLSGSTSDEIDCLQRVEEQDMERFRNALDCYVTYRKTIEQTGIKHALDSLVAFELFGERFDPPIAALDVGL